MPDDDFAAKLTDGTIHPEIQRWSRSRSACCTASVSTGASTIQSASLARSPPGNDSAGAHIKWMFTADKARAKMGRAYLNSFKESQPL